MSRRIRRQAAFIVALGLASCSAKNQIGIQVDGGAGASGRGGAGGSLGGGAGAGSSLGTGGAGDRAGGVGGAVAGGGGNAGAGGSLGMDGGGVAPSPFEAQTLAIAAEYLAWGRVDDELRWAPFLCRQPLPGIARPSESTDQGTHGQKLYSVFAKHHDTYPDGPHTDQVVVKQSWKIEPAGQDAGFSPASWRPQGDGGDHFYPYAEKDGVVYRATEPAGLFIMFKVDPATAETDAGWVYATVAPTGEVTSSGRVASCMGCHEASATHERLYGVPLSPSF